MIQKGLQLIAQFNFQRAPGVSTQKKHSGQRDKKPECRVWLLRQLSFL